MIDSNTFYSKLTTILNRFYSYYVISNRVLEAQTIIAQLAEIDARFKGTKVPQTLHNVLLDAKRSYLTPTAILLTGKEDGQQIGYPVELKDYSEALKSIAQSVEYKPELTYADVIGWFPHAYYEAKAYMKGVLNTKAQK